MKASLLIAAASAIGCGSSAAGPTTGNDQDINQGAMVDTNDATRILGTYRIVDADKAKPHSIQLLSIHPDPDGNMVNGDSPFFHLVIFRPENCASGDRDCDPNEEVESHWRIKLDNHQKPFLVLDNEDDGVVGRYGFTLEGDSLRLNQDGGTPAVAFEMKRVHDACASGGGKCVARGPLTDSPPDCKPASSRTTPEFVCDREPAQICCVPAKP